MLFCYNDEGEKLTSSQGHRICGVHMFSACLHGFSLGTVVSSHIPKMKMLGTLAGPHCLSECGWV